MTVRKGPFSPHASNRRHYKCWLPAYQTNKFDRSATPGTADGYLTTIDRGRFFASTGSGFLIPSGQFAYVTS